MQILAHLLLFSAPLHFMPQLHHGKIQLSRFLVRTLLKISHSTPFSFVVPWSFLNNRNQERTRILQLPMTQ